MQRILTPAERTAQVLRHKYERLAQQHGKEGASGALKKAMERKVRKDAPVSYTHLTLPTNREV